LAHFSVGSLAQYSIHKLKCSSSEVCSGFIEIFWVKYNRELMDDNQFIPVFFFCTISMVVEIKLFPMIKVLHFWNSISKPNRWLYWYLKKIGKS